MSIDLNEAMSAYVGIYNKDQKLLAIGVGYPEAFGRAQALGYDLSDEAKPKRRDVSGAQYRRWWEKGLSDEQRERLRLAGGSQPPPE
jgi:queuine/archaeosine tRNA-ribosyltransferase